MNNEFIINYNNNIEINEEKYNDEDEDVITGIYHYNYIYI